MWLRCGGEGAAREGEREGYTRGLCGGYGGRVDAGLPHARCVWYGWAGEALVGSKKGARARNEERERGSERERERGSPVEGGSRVFRFGIDLTGWRRRRLLETPRIKCTGTAWWLVPADVVPRGKSRLLESRTPPSAYARSVVLAPRRRSGCLRESPIGPMTVAVRSSECSLSEKRESELLRAGSPARMSAPCDTERRGWARPRASMTTTDDNAKNIFSKT